jgi:DNA-binding CsgD family transcriptional regulator
MFSGILDAVYESAIAAERWPDALQKLADAFHCGSVALIDRNLRTMEGRVTTTGIDPASQREFLEVWSAYDILRQKTKAWQPGAIETDQQILPRSELLASDYYNGFMKPRDMHAVMRLTLAIEGKFLKVITIIRPYSAGDFDSNAVQQCRLLMPHLQRAASISFHADEVKAMLGALSDVADRSVAAILLLDCNGKVKFANQSARAMAQTADSFRLRHDCIEVLDSQDDVALQRLIAGATGRLERTDAPRGGVMRLGRKSGKAAFTAVVSPVAQSSLWAENGPRAYVVINDPKATSIRPEAMLRQLFGLSATEARVAERLMIGDSPEQAAFALDVKISTVRWHLASLYRKTGTKRQGELVRLLLSLPTI